MDVEDAVRLRRVVLRLARTFAGAATAEGLTPTQASVLSRIAVRGPLPIAELARIEALNPSMTSRVVGALAERELIERTPDPDDLRAATVSATRAGRAVHRRLRTEAATAIRRAAARLTIDQQSALEEALDALEALAPRED